MPILSLQVYSPKCSYTFSNNGIAGQRKVVLLFFFFLRKCEIYFSANMEAGHDLKPNFPTDRQEASPVLCLKTADKMYVFWPCNWIIQLLINHKLYI